MSDYAIPPNKTLNFQLTEDQYQKYWEWRKTLPKEPKTAIGGAYSFEFSPTSLGDVIMVYFCRGLSSEQSIDLSDYDNW